MIASEQTSGMGSEEEMGLEAQNANLRSLLAQAGIDAAEHKVADRLQRILLDELHHRVKNTLAIVQAITNQSLRSAESLEQGREAIEARLAALGRVHDLLLRTSWDSVKLADLLKMATAPFDTLGAGQFFIQSTNIEVASGAALPLAMTLNELCTNAVKYGALSTPEGRVEITATVDERAKQFQLAWEEKGGPTVHAPTRRGFGTRLIERGFVGQLQGEARLTFAPGGVVCKLDVPLAALQPIISN
ncbi:sensor histidine kinase [Methylocella tundrae]|uniref:histidine kinase n=1 Tax=Methylocella tundrae TaxID=227605 RepID=A0A4U8Z5H4_METTU|nr:sensor histidine kinase [Methylocella tundrae]VFU10787.1 Two-component sensor histidine kinase, contains HisKA and HATPase domains [Methylocella tundrae]